MTHVVIFYVVQLLASCFALWRGGAPERWVATLMVLAAAATSVSSLAPGMYASVNWMQLYADVAFLAALLVVAARANRYWPIYLAALHLLGVGVHGVRALDPTIVPIVYARAAAATAYPMLLILVIGTARHARRLATYATLERDWSPVRW